MTDWTGNFVSHDGQLFRRTIGEMVAGILRERWPHHTAKHISRWAEIDQTTAANVAKGHASERSLTKVALAGGWAFWMAMGEALFGQSYSEWKEQELQQIIDEATRELGTVHRLRALDALVPSSPLDGGKAGLLDRDRRSFAASRGEGRQA